MTPRLFGRIPSPLEAVDAALDSAAEVIKFPGRLVENVAHGVEGGSRSVQSAIDGPKNYAEIPAPPDVIIQGALNAAQGLANGLVEGVGGIFDAVKETGEGVKSQIDTLVRR